jgi:mRNA-degrading endonuclease RelE of RelBE toxin-antitoxin system
MYQMEFTEGAAADLARLDKPIAQRVLRRLRWLAESFSSGIVARFTSWDKSSG